MTQKEALDILKMGHNVFLTGAAGSGKTYLLNEYISLLKNRGVGVGITASTGIAATHLGGMTIHSFAGIGIQKDATEDDITVMATNKRVAKRWLKTQVLVIDEISMLDADRLNLVDRVARRALENPAPFGGLQVVLCGDFFQLPPVAKVGEVTPRFAYEAEAWKGADIKVCYLSERHRQGDEKFLAVLDAIRANAADSAARSHLLTRRGLTSAFPRRMTKLYSHNVDVDAENHRELEKLSGKGMRYRMNERGVKAVLQSLKKGCLAPEELVLKKGAAVMFVKNNFEEGYVNGTLGVVRDFEENGFPVVETFHGDQIVAYPASWGVEENGKILAEIRQVPLRLAWAITIHKSQGMTLDAAEIDLSGAFERGMGYVALSRVRSLEGIRLLGLNQTALEVHPEVLAKDFDFKELSDHARKELNQMSPLEKEQRQKAFLGIEEPRRKEKPLSTYEKTKALLEEKLSLAEIAKERGMAEGTILGHMEKMASQGKELNLAHIRARLAENRLEEIKNAFHKSGGLKLSPVREILGDEFSYEELRLARLFLDK